ncbi:nitrogen regulation protein NR(II) [Geomicrobium sp. JCM 19039]|uniref:two-component system sensor histidine kinase NtrB n=1 Tax=Geomicrobium sp. JCM 19039 TaxID=1460636 RepID=UPI00045F4D8E|nr:ATP-binding protein [Geomicrobium sp. JCM 19039]GAK11488.1 sensor histidine kinase [Geomicrobium sp. JCM 19039]
MKDFAQVEDAYDEQRVFKQLSKEIRLVIQQDGTVQYKNEHAKEVLDRTDRFFATFLGYEWRKAMDFFKKMYETKRSEEAVLTHFLARKEIRVFYRGAFREDAFYLIGQVQSATDVKNREATGRMMKSLPCGYVRVNEKLTIVEMNRRFEKLVFMRNTFLLPELKLSSLQFESDYGRTIYECVMNAISTKQLSVKRFDAGNELRIAAYATYLPADDEIVGFIFDESAELKYENLLAYRQQMESVSHLAAGVAHELRNPLSVIRGFLQLSELTDSFHKYSHTIFSEVDRMNVIIENFLSMSRKKFERRLQNPMGVIRSVEDIIRSECLLHDVQFSSELVDTERKIFMNETMIKQVILNLLRNSVEAYKEDTTNKLFTLKTEMKDSRYVVTVGDNGQGIPPEILNKLGEPFTTTKEKGTGIGISLSKKLIEDHGERSVLIAKWGRYDCNPSPPFSR